MLRALQQPVPANERLGLTRHPVGAQNFDDWIGFQPRQLDAVIAAANAERILYGGAAGGGKSYLLRWYGIRTLMRLANQYQVRGVRIGLFSESYPTLEERQISKIRMEVPRWLGVMNNQRHELRLDKRYGGGVLCFRNLANPDDYLSGEYAQVLFEEQTQCPEEKYDFVCTRVRWPGVPEFENIAMGASNPGGIGHAYCKRRWIDRQLSVREHRHRYVYVPALCKDNKYIPSGYVENLMALPEKLAKAYAEGSWDIFEGQYFVEWTRDIHVVRPFQIPKSWPKFRCIDYGFAKPACCLWVAVNPWYSQLVVYRELYVTQHNPEQFAKRILQLTPADEEIFYTVLDPACWSNEKGHGSTADDMRMHGLICEPGNNDRLDGWFRVRQYLEPWDVLHDGKIVTVARLVYFNTCLNSIRTVPSLIHDDIRVEDVDTDSEDHAGDAIRYGVMSRPAMEMDTSQKELQAFHQRVRLEGLLKEFPSLRRGRQRDEWAEGELYS